MKKNLIIICLLAGVIISANAQSVKIDTPEVTGPEPKVVTPGRAFIDAPSDAIVLFDGKNLNEWVSGDDRSKPAEWTVHDDMLTVNKKVNDIQTKRLFTNYQLHIEWKIPADIEGEGQERGNSGIFLAAFANEQGYELQVLDPYKNPTYVNGMAASIYRQFIPLVNPGRKPGEWQSYDIVWRAPLFNNDGSLKSPAIATVFFNGILAQDHVVIQGPTWYEGHPKYVKHGACPLALQKHFDNSKPVSYRNIWIRELL
jgi:Domain of Unknown Function (DUF1080)